MYFYLIDILLDFLRICFSVLLFSSDLTIVKSCISSTVALFPSPTLFDKTSKDLWLAADKVASFHSGSDPSVLIFIISLQCACSF